MTRLIFTLAALSLFSTAATNPTEFRMAQASGASELDEAVGRMDMTGMDLYMHDYAPTDGAPRKPSLWVHADSGQATDDAEVWKVEGAHGVIYGDPDKGTEDLVVNAEHAIFDRRNNVARMNGNVTVETGTIHLMLDAIEWDNEANLARSHSAVTIRDGDTQLDADSLVLDPDSGSFVLTNVSGRLALQGAVR